MFRIAERNKNQDGGIKMDEDNTVIGLSVPIEEPPATEAYPPTHHHSGNSHGKPQKIF